MGGNSSGGPLPVVFGSSSSPWAPFTGPFAVLDTPQDPSWAALLSAKAAGDSREVRVRVTVRATHGCITCTSTRVFGDQMCQKTRTTEAACET